MSEACTIKKSSQPSRSTPCMWTIGGALKVPFARGMKNVVEKPIRAMAKNA